MYNVEIIPKQQTIIDVIDFWKATGREDNTHDGQFVFENADNAYVENGCIIILREDEIYVYNMSDFYRVKIIKKVAE
jgi:hypothetical protein